MIKPIKKIPPLSYWLIFKRHTNSIQCDDCEQWVHQKCSHLTNERFESISLEGTSWYCWKCTSVALPYNNIEDDDLLTENLIIPNLSNNVKIIPST